MRTGHKRHERHERHEKHERHENLDCAMTSVVAVEAAPKIVKQTRMTANLDFPLVSAPSSFATGSVA